MLFAGCAKDDQQPNPPTAEPIEPIEFSHQMLKFSSMDDLNQTIWDLTYIQEPQMKQWYAEKDAFLSQQGAANLINRQMRRSTLDQALALRDAYSDLFIFDPNTEELHLSPIAPSRTPCYAWVCNAYGDVEIAGQVVNLNEISTYAQTRYATMDEMAKSLKLCLVPPLIVFIAMW